jgi:long-chain acyl-CoA synthetase
MPHPWHAHYDPGVPADVEVPGVPFTFFLDRAAAGYGDRPAVSFYGGRLTWRQLGQACDRFAAGLHGLGVRKGDRVALQLPNCPQFVIAYFGALKAGAVVTPISPLYVPREIEHQCRDSGAETLVTLPRFYPKVQSIRAATALKRIVVTGIQEHMGWPTRWLYTLFREKAEGDRVPVAPGDVRWRDLLSAAPAAVPVVPVSGIRRAGFRWKPRWAGGASRPGGSRSRSSQRRSRPRRRSAASAGGSAG